MGMIFIFSANLL